MPHRDERTGLPTLPVSLILQLDDDHSVTLLIDNVRFQRSFDVVAKLTDDARITATIKNPVAAFDALAKLWGDLLHHDIMHEHVMREQAWSDALQTVLSTDMPSPFSDETLASLRTRLDSIDIIRNADTPDPVAITLALDAAIDIAREALDRASQYASTMIHGVRHDDDR
jgi:hypothetical protein